LSFYIDSAPSPHQDDLTKIVELSSGEVIHEHDNFNHTSDEVTPESISESIVVKPAAQQSIPSHECSGNNFESSNSVVAHTADIVDISGSDDGACGTTIADKTYSLSSESCSDVASMNQLMDSDATQLQTVQLDVFPEKEIPARISEDDKQLIAMACYETVMEMVKNHNCDDSLLLDNNPDAETLQQSKPVSLDVLLEEETTIPQPKLNRSPYANMQHVAMACYETVMEMVRSDDILSSSMSDSHRHDGNDTSIQSLDSHNVQQYSQEKHVTVHHSNEVNVLLSSVGHVTKPVDHHSKNVQPFSHTNPEGVELPLSDDGTVDSLQQMVVTDVRSNADNGLLQKLERVTPSDDSTVVVNKKLPCKYRCRHCLLNVFVTCFC